MRRIVSTAAFAVFFGGAVVEQQPQTYLADSFVAAIAETQTISDVLAKGMISGSLEYSGKCIPPVIVPDLPPIRQLKANAKNPADSFRSMFSENPRMVVSPESNGIIRIVEDGIQTDVVRITIGHLYSGDHRSRRGAERGPRCAGGSILYAIPRYRAAPQHLRSAPMGAAGSETCARLGSTHKSQVTSTTSRWQMLWTTFSVSFRGFGCIKTANVRMVSGLFISVCSRYRGKYGDGLADARPYARWHVADE